MSGQWNCTISWAYSQAPDSSDRRGGKSKDQWVTDYLASCRHWSALEEHLRFLASVAEDIERSS